MRQSTFWSIRGVPGELSQSLRRTGREIPSFFILAINVVRLSPKRAAAPHGPPIVHPAAWRLCKIRARVESSKVSCERAAATGLLPDIEGLMAAFTSDFGSVFGRTPLFDRITARSIKF